MSSSSGPFFSLQSSSSHSLGANHPSHHSANRQNQYPYQHQSNSRPPSSHGTSGGGLQPPESTSPGPSPKLSPRKIGMALGSPSGSHSSHDHSHGGLNNHSGNTAGVYGQGGGLAYPTGVGTYSSGSGASPYGHNPNATVYRDSHQGTYITTSSSNSLPSLPAMPPPSPGPLGKFVNMFLKNSASQSSLNLAVNTSGDASGDARTASAGGSRSAVSSPSAGHPDPFMMSSPSMSRSKSTSSSASGLVNEKKDIKGKGKATTLHNNSPVTWPEPGGSEADEFGSFANAGQGGGGMGLGLSNVGLGLGIARSKTSPPGTGVVNNSEPVPSFPRLGTLPTSHTFPSLSSTASSPPVPSTSTFPSVHKPQHKPPALSLFSSHAHNTPSIVAQSQSVTNQGGSFGGSASTGTGGLGTGSNRGSDPLRPGSGPPSSPLPGAGSSVTNSNPPSIFSHPAGSQEGGYRGTLGAGGVGGNVAGDGSRAGGYSHGYGGLGVGGLYGGHERGWSKDTTVSSQYSTHLGPDGKRQSEQSVMGSGTRSRTGSGIGNTGGEGAGAGPSGGHGFGYGGLGIAGRPRVEKERESAKGSFVASLGMAPIAPSISNHSLNTPATQGGSNTGGGFLGLPTLGLLGGQSHFPSLKSLGSGGFGSRTGGGTAPSKSMSSPPGASAPPITPAHQQQQEPMSTIIPTSQPSPPRPAGLGYVFPPPSSATSTPTTTRRLGSTQPKMDPPSTATSTTSENLGKAKPGFPGHGPLVIRNGASSAGSHDGHGGASDLGIDYPYPYPEPRTSLAVSSEAHGNDLPRSDSRARMEVLRASGLMGYRGDTEGGSTARGPSEQSPGYSTSGYNSLSNQPRQSTSFPELRAVAQLDQDRIDGMKEGEKVGRELINRTLMANLTRNDSQVGSGSSPRGEVREMREVWRERAEAEGNEVRSGGGTTTMLMPVTGGLQSVPTSGPTSPFPPNTRAPSQTPGPSQSNSSGGNANVSHSDDNELSTSYSTRPHHTQNRGHPPISASKPPRPRRDPSLSFQVPFDIPGFNSNGQQVLSAQPVPNAYEVYVSPKPRLKPKFVDAVVGDVTGREKPDPSARKSLSRKGSLLGLGGGGGNDHERKRSFSHSHFESKGSGDMLAAMDPARANLTRNNSQHLVSGVNVPTRPTRRTSSFLDGFAEGFRQAADAARQGALGPEAEETIRGLRTVKSANEVWKANEESRKERAGWGQEVEGASWRRTRRERSLSRPRKRYNSTAGSSFGNGVGSAGAERAAGMASEPVNGVGSFLGRGYGTVRSKPSYAFSTDDIGAGIIPTRQSSRQSQRKLIRQKESSERKRSESMDPFGGFGMSFDGRRRAKSAPGSRRGGRAGRNTGPETSSWEDYDNHLPSPPVPHSFGFLRPSRSKTSDTGTHGLNSQSTTDTGRKQYSMDRPQERLLMSARDAGHTLYRGHGHAQSLDSKRESIWDRSSRPVVSRKRTSSVPLEAQVISPFMVKDPTEDKAPVLDPTIKSRDFVAEPVPSQSQIGHLQYFREGKAYDPQIGRALSPQNAKSAPQAARSPTKRYFDHQSQQGESFGSLDRATAAALIASGLVGEGESLQVDTSSRALGPSPTPPSKSTTPTRPPNRSPPGPHPGFTPLSAPPRRRGSAGTNGGTSPSNTLPKSTTPDAPLTPEESERRTRRMGSVDLASQWQAYSPARDPQTARVSALASPTLGGTSSNSLAAKRQYFESFGHLPLKPRKEDDTSSAMESPGRTLSINLTDESGKMSARSDEMERNVDFDDLFFHPPSQPQHARLSVMAMPSDSESGHESLGSSSQHHGPLPGEYTFGQENTGSSKIPAPGVPPIAGIENRTRHSPTASSDQHDHWQDADEGHLEEEKTSSQLISEMVAEYTESNRRAVGDTTLQAPLPSEEPSESDHRSSNNQLAIDPAPLGKVRVSRIPPYQYAYPEFARDSVMSSGSESGDGEDNEEGTELLVDTPRLHAGPQPYSPKARASSELGEMDRPTSMVPSFDDTVPPLPPINYFTQAGETVEMIEEPSRSARSSTQAPSTVQGEPQLRVISSSGGERPLSPTAPSEGEVPSESSFLDLSDERESFSFIDFDSKSLYRNSRPSFIDFQIAPEDVQETDSFLNFSPPDSPTLVRPDLSPNDVNFPVAGPSSRQQPNPPNKGVHPIRTNLVPSLGATPSSPTFGRHLSTQSHQSPADQQLSARPSTHSGSHTTSAKSPFSFSRESYLSSNVSVVSSLRSQLHNFPHPPDNTPEGEGQDDEDGRRSSGESRPSTTSTRRPRSDSLLDRAGGTERFSWDTAHYPPSYSGRDREGRDNSLDRPIPRTNFNPARSSSRYPSTATNISGLASFGDALDPGGSGGGSSNRTGAGMGSKSRRARSQSRGSRPSSDSFI